MNQSYQKLLLNNRNWVAEKLNTNPDFFSSLAEGQAPEYLFIGCSDSRITHNEMTGTQAGEMFVHRNIANVAVHDDINMMSVLQYAIEVLRVKHIIVCGHYGCGGIQAALDAKPKGQIDKWLKHIKEVYRRYSSHIDTIGSEALKLKKLVELNVLNSVHNVVTSSFMQNALAKKQDIQVHGWVYDLAHGYILDLDIRNNRDYRELRLKSFTPTRQ